MSLERSEASRRVNQLYTELLHTRQKTSASNSKKILELAGKALEIAWDPKDISTFEGYRSWALECLGQYDEAFAAIERSQKTAPAGVEMWGILRSRVCIREKQGNLAEAIEECNKQTAYYFEFTKGSLDLMNKFFISAAGDWRKRAELQFEFALRSEAAHQQRLFDEMISGFDDLIRINPRSHQAWFNRGEMYLKLERYDLALADFTKALSLTTKTTPMYRHLEKLIKKTQKLIDKPPKKKQFTLEPQTQPTPSAPPPSTETRQNHSLLFKRKTEPVKPSAPPPGTKTLINFPPAYQTATESNKASAPVMGTQTQERIAAQSWGYIQPHEITFSGQLGKGGMGIVYRATWKSISVAVKMITDPKADQTSIRNEYCLIAKLDHPNIIFSQGFTTGANGEFCLVMELHPKSLTSYLLHEDRPLKRRVFCAIGVARGLEYLHGCGVLHRDLKTDNILITADRPYERAVITDFGISRKLAPEQTYQDSHYIEGTVTHIAPEILAPRPGELPQYSQFSDMYADALVNWSLLTRQFPFENLDARSIIKAVAEKDQRPAIPEIALENEMPGFIKGKKGIAHLLRRGWDRDPKQRPPAKEVGDTFEKIYAKMK